MSKMRLLRYFHQNFVLRKLSKITIQLKILSSNEFYYLASHFYNSTPIFNPLEVSNNSLNGCPNSIKSCFFFKPNYSLSIKKFVETKSQPWTRRKTFYVYILSYSRVSSSLCMNKKTFWICLWIINFRRFYCGTRRIFASPLGIVWKSGSEVFGKCQVFSSN